MPLCLICTSACRRNATHLGIVAPASTRTVWDRAGSILPWHSPCNPTLRGLNLVTLSLHNKYPGIYKYILKEDGLKLILTQFPFIFIFLGRYFLWQHGQVLEDPALGRCHCLGKFCCIFSAQKVLNHHGPEPKKHWQKKRSTVAYIC